MTTETAIPETAQRFFTVGGTLPPDAPSYVMRQADEDLFAHLSAGHFCYLLTSRQMGKSSLMVRTTTRLKAAGVRVAILDLTKIGQNVTTDQWYNGLLRRLGVAFGLEDKLKEFSGGADAASRSLGPLDRWEQAVREVIVPSIPEKIVIFVDEIDFVRSLPFPTDEFFAAIRSFYNQRTTHPELSRITFCLIGVATPTDLIRDGSRTPFNIGERINLTDFHEQEGQPFIKGMGRPPEIGARLLRRILWWTGGHPYLTQRLCAAVAADPTVTTASGVDRVCNDLYLTAHSRDSDNNLLFVSHRITDRNSAAHRAADKGSEGDPDKETDGELAAVLDLYGRIRAGKPVLFDKENRLIEFLLLAGIVTVHDRVPVLHNFFRKLGAVLHGQPLTGAERVSEQVLVVRNRVYERVFDKHWIRAHMPGAELRRQRAAFRRGLLRASGVAIAVLILIGIFMLRDFEEEQMVAIRGYCSNLVQVQQNFDSGDFATGFNLLRETESNVRLGEGFGEKLLAGTPLLRRTLPFILRHPWLYAILNGFDQKASGGLEWNYLLARSFGDSAFAYTGHADEVRTVAISPDGQWAVTAGADSTVRVFNVGSILQSPGAAPNYAPNNPLDRALLVLDNNGHTRLSKPDGTPNWNVNTELIHALNDQKLTLSQLPGVNSVQFSPDGAWIAVATGNWNQPQNPGTVYLWSTRNPGNVIWLQTQFARAADAVVFRTQPDAKGAYLLACTSEDNAAKFWSVALDGTIAAQGEFDASAKTSKGMNAAAFSPDGKTFATIFGDGHLWIRDGAQPWNTGSSGPIVGDISGLMSIAFYDHPLTGIHQGSVEQLILLGTRDGHVKSYEANTNTMRNYLDTGQGLVTSLTVSKDRNLLVTTGSTGTVLVWQLLRDVHDSSLEQDSVGTPGDGIMLSGQRDVTYSAAITPNNSLIVSGGANALNGSAGSRTIGGKNISKEDQALLNLPNSNALQSAPGGRVLFWKKQRGYVDGFILQGEATPSTWASQPASILTGDAVQALAFSPDGTEFASIGGTSPQDNAQTEIDFASINPQTAKPAAPATPVTVRHSAGTALAWSGDGKSVVTAMSDGSVLVWDPLHIAQDSKPLTTPVVNNASLPIQALSFSPDGWLAGTAAATGAPDLTFTWNQKPYRSNQSILLWKPAQSPAIRQVVQLPPMQKPVQPPTDRTQRYFLPQKVAFSPSGNWLAACGIDSFDNQVKVQIWTTSGLLDAAPRPLQALDGSEFPPSHDHVASLHGNCTAIAFSPDGAWLAVGTYSHEIAVWSTATWLRVEGDYSPSGSLYGSTGVTHGRYLDAPPMTTSAINAVAFSPDSLRLAYGAADGKIYLWSVTAHLPVSTIAVHTGGVLSLAFSPNGNCLASGSNDQTVRFSCGIDPAFKLSRQNISISIAYYLRLSKEADVWAPFAQ
ncbi:MAG: AAA-like domain-containing protein [Acidobacteriaceae bacterium]|jgi:WD40 repeat protein